MIENEEKTTEGNFLFATAVEMMPALTDIPLKELREEDIFVLQNISKAASHDGIRISIGVDLNDKLLIALRFNPDLRSGSKSLLIDSVHPTIYIANDVSSKKVFLALQAISERYCSLSPPPYFEYDPDAGTTRFDQWTTVDVGERYEHDLFMREHGMFHISIPEKYKRNSGNYDQKYS